MIKIITDSTVYIRHAEAAELCIRVIPIAYTIKGVRYSEYYSDTDSEFIKYIEHGGKITTIQPDSKAFSEAFREELNAGNEVLCITLSSRLSGIFSSAVTAAEKVDSKSESIHVFDSRLTAGGLYLLVCEAKKLIDDGKRINEILLMLEKIRDKITSYFSVDDMTPLRESGRIGFVRMGVGTILNIKPILLCRDGMVVFEEAARGTNDIIRKLTEKIPANAQNVVINYINSNSIASNLYNVIKSKCPDLDIQLSELGPVLTAHLGIGVVAVSFITL